MDVGSLCSNPRRFESIYPELIIRYGRQAFRVASPYTYELDWQYFPPSALTWRTFGIYHSLLAQRMKRSSLPSSAGTSSWSSAAGTSGGANPIGIAFKTVM